MSEFIATAIGATVFIVIIERLVSGFTRTSITSRAKMGDPEEAQEYVALFNKETEPCSKQS